MEASQKLRHIWCHETHELVDADNSFSCVVELRKRAVCPQEVCLSTSVLQGRNPPPSIPLLREERMKGNIGNPDEEKRAKRGLGNSGISCEFDKARIFLGLLPVRPPARSHSPVGFPPFRFLFLSLCRSKMTAPGFLGGRGGKEESVERC